MVQRTKNGWRVRVHPGKGTFVAPNGKTVYCADEYVATIFQYLTEQWDKRIEKLPKATYNTFPNERKGLIVVHCSRPKPLNGLVDSNHQSHTAIDINGHLHHYERSCSLANGSSGCWGDKRKHAYISGFSARQESELRAIQREVGKNANGDYILRLGIDFAPGWRDAMHVEISPGTTNADTVLAAGRLKVGEAVVDLTEVAVGLQALSFPVSEAGVRAYQEENKADPHSLVVDGKAGPKTKAAIGADMATLQEIKALLDEHRGAVEYIDLTDSTMERLGTGIRRWRFGALIDLIGRRVGRNDQRLGQLTLQMGALEKAVGKIAEAQGMTKARVQEIFVESMSEAKVEITFDEEGE